MSVSLNFFVLCLGSTKLHAKIRLYTPLRMPGLTYISRRRNSVVIISLPKCMISNSKRAHTFQTRGTWWKGCDREREARFPPSAVSLLSSLAVSLWKRPVLLLPAFSNLLPVHRLADVTATRFTQKFVRDGGKSSCQILQSPFLFSLNLSGRGTPTNAWYCFCVLNLLPGLCLSCSPCHWYLLSLI